MSSGTVLIRNGLVVDGTATAALVTADVAIAGGRIVEVGRLPSIEGSEEIDAAGLVVAPGFIDMHSHSDFTLLVDPRAVSSITQGVTFEVIGNCGYGCCPIGDPNAAKEVIYGYTPEVPITWTSVAGYLERLEVAKPAVNVALLVPNGQLRLATIGLASRRAASDDLVSMKRLLKQGLEEGAVGLSTGLEYATEQETTEEEVIELCRLVAAVDGFHATHTRNRDSNAIEAVAEAVRTAERSGVRLQISHITPRSGKAATERCIDLVDRALLSGVDVAFDMHTRLFGTTYLKALLPSWAFESGTGALATRLRDPVARAAIKDYRSLISSLGDWERIVLLDNPAFPEISRLSIGEISKRWGRPPLDCALDILLAEVEQIHRPMVVLHCYSEDQLRLTYRHPACMIGSDATALAPDGPLAGSVFHGAYSWVSWFFRRMVRETGAFSLAAAIHRLTGLPAERLRLSDRGTIRPGAWADLCMFRADDFGETATTFDPNRLARGMVHVFVNGTQTLRDGCLTGRRAGMVVRAA